MNLEKLLTNEGYTNLRYIDGVGWCGLYRFIFTTGLCIGLDDVGYKGRYCYPTHLDASEALKEWDGTNDPSGNWIKYKGEGGERSNQNIES